MPETQHLRSGPRHAHESKDASFWPIVWFSVALLAIVGLALVGLSWVLDYWNSHQPEPQREFSALQAQQLPPSPRLETVSGVELEQLRAREDAVLGSYGWVDQSAGVVRIPIEVAIGLVAQRGLPARSTNPQQLSADRDDGSNESSVASEGPTTDLGGRQ